MESLNIFSFGYANIDHFHLCILFHGVDNCSLLICYTINGHMFIFL